MDITDMNTTAVNLGLSLDSFSMLSGLSGIIIAFLVTFVMLKSVD